MKLFAKLRTTFDRVSSERNTDKSPTPGRAVAPPGRPGGPPQGIRSSGPAPIPRASGKAASVDPVKTTACHGFEPLTLNYEHAELGSLEIVAHKTPDKANDVYFRVTLTSKDRASVSFVQTMALEGDVIGYFDFGHEEHMKGKKAGAALAHACALVGQRLGVRDFAIRSVVVDQMHDLCADLGMKFGLEGYSGACTGVVEQARRLSEARGWMAQQ
jgi:hypothetical protein